MATLEAEAGEALSDVDSEQAVLGILLDDTGRNDTWQEACSIIRRNVTGEDFFRPAHRTIFEVIAAVTEETGHDADFPGIVKRLPNDSRTYAASLVSAMQSSVHAGWYAAKVREAAIRRRAIASLGDAAKALYDPQRPVQAALEECHLLLDEATTGLNRDTGIFDVARLSDEVDDLYEHGSSRGVETGWFELDSHYRVAPGEWTLVTGIPSHGKSAFVDALMVNLARRQHWNFAVCSPENQPLARHVSKLAKIWAGKPFDLGPEPRMSYEELVDAKAFLYDHFTFVLPHDRERSVGGVLNCMEAVAQRGPLNGIVIDPWNELDHSRPSGQTETEFISESLTRIRQFARRHQVHVWLVAHPAKLQRPNDDKPYPVPRPYDVSGSAHWFNKADNCLAVYRDDADRWVQIHIQKVRFDVNGKRGVVELQYNRLTGQFLGAAA